MSLLYHFNLEIQEVLILMQCFEVSDYKDFYIF